MGSLLELVISFGIFAACLAGGVLAIYTNLADTGQLYEVGGQAAQLFSLAPNGGTLESSSRRDAEAYAAFSRSAREYGLAQCDQYFVSSVAIADSSGSPFRQSSSPLTYPSGYSITFLQIRTYSSVSAGSQALNSTVSAPVVAQLRRGSSTGPVIAEALIRCSASKL